MKARFPHRSVEVALSPTGDRADPASPFVLSSRACCCPARPVVTVMMPPGPGRADPVDLLLCGHHYRVHRAALEAAGATFYDETGAPVPGGADEYLLVWREPADTAPYR